MLLKTSLLPWQEKAVNKLIGIRVGALYMEMGTGKTRTALEMIKRRMDAGKLDKVLWLCPCSVQSTIRSEIEKHAEKADFILIRGIESLSGSVRLYGELMQYVANGNTMLVVDESNLVKNDQAIRSRRVISIAEQCKYRIILNGTPISKNEKDLYAQWYLLDWRILGYKSFWSFAANHLEYDPDRPGLIRRVLNTDYLTDKIAPYSYMVKKEECIELPQKQYRSRWFFLTSEQCEHYDNVKEDYLTSLLSDDRDISTSAIYRAFTALQDVTSGRIIISDVKKPIVHVPMFQNPNENPRIESLLSIVDDLSGKIVVWCKYTHEIEDVSLVLRERFGNESTVLFYGEMNRKKRDEALGAFRNHARFLVANKTCAGYGLNLQFCHNAIYYNNDWDWATRAQSEDRLHRLGQENEIILYDIYAIETIDERILKCLAKKENLSDEFKMNMKSKNLSSWIDGSDGDDQDRVRRREQATRSKGRSREKPYQEGGRILSASLSD